MSDLSYLKLRMLSLAINLSKYGSSFVDIGDYLLPWSNLHRTSNFFHSNSGLRKSREISGKTLKNLKIVTHFNTECFQKGVDRSLSSGALETQSAAQRWRDQRSWRCMKK